MHLSQRRDYLIASCLYFVVLAIYLLPALYLMLPEPIGPARHAGIALGPVLAVAMITGVIQLALFTALGLGIRAGRTWAKVIYGLILAYALYYFGKSASSLLHQSFWVASRNLFGLALMLGIAFFLFRGMLRRPVAGEAGDAGVAQGGHSRVN
jgi:hypothetical protein